MACSNGAGDGRRHGPLLKLLTASWQDPAIGANRRLTLTRLKELVGTGANLMRKIQALAAMLTLIVPARAVRARAVAPRNGGSEFAGELIRAGNFTSPPLVSAGLRRPLLDVMFSG
jgi:hypothetical protein